MLIRRKELNKDIKLLNITTKKLNELFEKSNIEQLVELLGNKKKLFLINLFSGMFKGLGIGIGFYIITAIVIILLNYIVKLNIPIIGDYIADIVEIVELNRK